MPAKPMFSRHVCAYTSTRNTSRVVHDNSGFFIAFQRFSPEIRPWSSTDVHPGVRRFLAKIVSILVTSASVTNSCFRNYRKPCLHQYFQGFSLFIFSGAFPQNPTRKRLTASLTKFLAPKLFPSSVATKFLSAFIPRRCPRQSLYLRVSTTTLKITIIQYNRARSL